MHIPILLAGFVCGPIAGIVVGLLAPTLSFLLSGMPPPYAVPLMSLELAVLGMAAGLAYRRLRLNIYMALVVAMVVGRLGFALGLILLGTFIDLPYGVKYYFTVAVTAGLPGMAIQMIILPPIVAAIMRRRGTVTP